MLLGPGLSPGDPHTHPHRADSEEDEVVRMTKKPRLELAEEGGGGGDPGSIKSGLETTEDALGRLVAEEVRVGSSAEAVFPVPLALGMTSVGAVLAPRSSAAEAGAGITSPLYLPNNLDLDTVPQVRGVYFDG